jgi:hypothetical protein
MNLRELLEHKKGVRAKKYNRKPKSYIDPQKPVAPEEPHKKPKAPTSIVFEADREPHLMQAFRDFLPLAMKQLGINKLPPIKLKKRVPEQDQPTFGRFENDSQIIYLAIEDRQTIDILRTLAHELVHFKQLLQHKLDRTSGNTGSQVEDEAHKIAGVIMRHFDKQFPEYFNDEALDID